MRLGATKGHQERRVARARLCSNSRQRFKPFGLWAGRVGRVHARAVGHRQLVQVCELLRIRRVGRGRVDCAAYKLRRFPPALELLSRDHAIVVRVHALDHLVDLRRTQLQPQQPGKLRYLRLAEVA
jgi:hypothetical protein